MVEDGHTLPHNRLHAQSNSHRISNNVSQQVGKSIRSRGVTSPSPVYLSSHSSSPASKSQLPSPSSLDSKTEQLRHRSFQRGSRASTSSSYHGESPNVGVMPSTSPNALNKHEDIWSTVSLTDSYYNETQTFSTHGIRRSFLRFFVSMLRKYPQYLVRKLFFLCVFIFYETRVCSEMMMKPSTLRLHLMRMDFSMR